ARAEGFIVGETMTDARQERAKREREGLGSLPLRLRRIAVPRPLPCPRQPANFSRNPVGLRLAMPLPGGIPPMRRIPSYLTRALPPTAVALGVTVALVGTEGCGRKDGSSSSDVMSDVPSLVFAKRANFDKSGKAVVAGGSDQIIDY